LIKKISKNLFSSKFIIIVAKRHSGENYAMHSHQLGLVNRRKGRTKKKKEGKDKGAKKRFTAREGASFKREGRGEKSLHVTQ